jgi:sorting nexin-13
MKIVLNKIKKATKCVMSHLHCSGIVDLISDHIDLFRRNQAAIGRDVMLTLSSEERDERLKFHLLKSKELHPALISPESEYKV